MSTVRSFEELEIWQLAREIARDVYELTRKELFSRDFSLVDQIRRSSGSSMDNIAEGFERSGNKEFIQFLSVAKGSAGETRSQLYRAYDQKYIDKDEFDLLYTKLIELSSKMKSFMNYLKTTSYKGQKYK
jgi:four helix bundle protein